jgi:hypothetical protein
MTVHIRNSRRRRGGRWYAGSAGLFLALLALSACADVSTGPSSAPPTGDAPTYSPPPLSEPAEPSATTGGDPPPESCRGKATVEVATADELTEALDAARPGTTIQLAPGRYEGNFEASAKGTDEEPIRLCGSRDAVLDGGDIDGDYTLHLEGADHWQLTGFTVTGGKKGVMVDAGTGNRIEFLLVTSMGDEAIHLRTNSTSNAVVGNTVRDTGLRKPKYGEGIYVGSAESNWCRQTGCEPDHSDDNVIARNDIAGTTAEAVDIKEGTTGGRLTGNTFDGAAMVEADSWVDVKGNDWVIDGNRGSGSPEDGFQVHEVVDGWGRGNVFTGNTAADISGLVVNAAGPRELRASTTVRCDNTSTGDAGRSNVECEGA